jgi:hypothetical protein
MPPQFVISRFFLLKSVGASTITEAIGAPATAYPEGDEYLVSLTSESGGFGRPCHSLTGPTSTCESIIARTWYIRSGFYADAETHVQAYQMISPLNTKLTAMRKLSYQPT